MAITNLHDYLTSIANTIRNKKGTSSQINAQDFASEIESIEGGGSGGATLKGGWTGTAVPVDETTYIENIYLNIQMSVGEVVSLIETNISLSPGFIQYGQPVCYVCWNSDGTKGVIATNMQGVLIIADVLLEQIYFAYDSTGAGQDMAETGFSGWNPDFNGVVEINDVQNERYIAVMSLELNDNLKSLFSITPFETVNIPLSGTYEGKELVITENGTTDLLNGITNNKEIITSVKSGVIVDYQKLISTTKGAPSLYSSSFIDETWLAENKDFLEQYMQMVVNADYSAVHYFVESFQYLFFDYSIVGIEVNTPTKIKINNDIITTSDYTTFDHTFMSCLMLKTIDINFINNAGRLYSVFKGCGSLTTLIIRNLGSRGVPVYDETLSNCPHFTGETDSTYNPNGLKDGKLYVPDSYVDSFKTASGWSDFADCIYPLSEYVEE